MDVPITVTITPAAHPSFYLGVTASASATQVQPGQMVTYTFTYTNTGPNDCTDADMTATIPSDLSVNSVTSSNGQAIQKTSGSIDDLGPLPVGGIVVVTVQCTANSTSEPETATTTAMVSPFNFVTGNDTNPSNTASVTTDIVPSTTQNPPPPPSSGPFTVSPQDLTFSVPAGQAFSNSQTLTITNQSSSQIFVTPTEAGDIPISVSELDNIIVIPPGGTYQLTVSVTLLDAGNYSGSITITQTGVPLGGQVETFVVNVTATAGGLQD